MLKKRKVALTYHSGGYGPKEIFYTEKLIVTNDYIEYKKMWEANKEVDNKDNIEEDNYFYNDYHGFDESDISWKLLKTNKGYNKLVNELESLAISSLSESMRFERVCDGDWLDYEIIDDRGYKISYGFSLCAFDDVKTNISNILKPYLKNKVLVPGFLKK